ncbi:MAG: hypothetical protein U0169_23030 [Polyangiaceae bacterium]
MILERRGIHANATVAILGSGPSLVDYRGSESVAIAVNGGAFTDRPYTYFVCGDRNAPGMPWFHESERRGIPRIVSSFVAVRDPVLYPRARTRLALRLELAVHSLRPGAYHSFEPSTRPVAPHAWFRYREAAFPESDDEIFRSVEDGRFLHGATIAGVALQMAWLFGASRIRLYGVGLDNDTGDRYAHAGRSRGRSTPLQRTLLSRLASAVERRGVPVEVHGACRWR